MFRFIIIACLISGISFSANAQKKKKAKYLQVEELNAESFSVWKGKTLAKTKRICIPRTSIHFKTTTNESTTFGRGTNSTTVGAWANVQGVSDETRQALVDEFYEYLVKGIEGLGIEVVPYEQVLASPAFVKFSDKQVDRVLSNKKYGVNQIFTYKNGPHTKSIVGNPGIWNASKKVAKDLEANFMMVDVTLDFTRFSINFKKDKSVFYNAGFVDGYSYDKVYTSTKAKSAAIPQIIIQQSNGALTFGVSNTGAFIGDAKGLSTGIALVKDAKANGLFATNIESYRGKLPEGMRKGIRIGDHMDTGTFVITADDMAFKAAASAALRHYADGLIAAMKANR